MKYFIIAMLTFFIANTVAAAEKLPVQQDNTETASTHNNGAYVYYAPPQQVAPAQAPYIPLQNPHPVSMQPPTVDHSAEKTVDLRAMNF